MIRKKKKENEKGLASHAVVELLSYSQILFLVHPWGTTITKESLNWDTTVKVLPLAFFQSNEFTACSIIYLHFPLATLTHLLVANHFVLGSVLSSVLQVQNMNSAADIISFSITFIFFKTILASVSLLLETTVLSSYTVCGLYNIIKKDWDRHACYPQQPVEFYWWLKDLNFG